MVEGEWGVRVVVERKKDFGLADAKASRAYIARVELELRRRVNKGRVRT